MRFTPVPLDLRSPVHRLQTPRRADPRRGDGTSGMIRLAAEPSLVGATVQAIAFDGLRPQARIIVRG